MSSLDRFPLQYLAAFRAAAKTQNLRAAAESLHLTHSAVSQQIRALEGHLGFALFDRHGRRLSLNPAGAALERTVTRMFTELRLGLQAAAQVHGQAARTLRLTALPSFVQRWLIPRLHRWQVAQPHIALDLHSSQQLVDLEREGFQLGMRVGHGPWPGLVSERLFHSPLVPVAAPSLASALVGQPLQVLAEQPLLGDADEWRAWFTAAGLRIEPNVLATFNDAGLMLQATEQGLGLALARELLAADALIAGRLVKIAAAALDDDSSRHYQVVYPEALQNDPAVRAFCDWLHEEIAQVQAQLRGTAAADR